MSVTFITVRCLSNTVVKVSRNCCESVLNIAVFKQFQNGTFKKVTIIVTEVALIQLFSYRWFSTKNKNENTEYLAIFISFKSQLFSKQGNPIFILFGS